MGNLFSGNSNNSNQMRNNSMANNAMMNNQMRNNSMANNAMMNNQMRNNSAKNAHRAQMNHSIMTNSENVQYIGAPTGVYKRPGYSASDPLKQYENICNKCENVEVEKPSHRGISPMDSQNTGGPQPYDPDNYLRRNVNVCFPENRMSTQCQLR